MPAMIEGMLNLAERDMADLAPRAPCLVAIAHPPRSRLSSNASDGRAGLILPPTWSPLRPGDRMRGAEPPSANGAAPTATCAVSWPGRSWDPAALNT